MVDDGRGDPWEHDPGPTNASGWAALFADTPNYRGLGRAVLGREAFRWQHGPMFFRGRLDGSAKVVLVGQEGAQDESLSHRSFTGGTGARMQHFLHHLGLDRSYLFLNSFVYPIFGQYSDALRPLAQDRRSPIAQHRNRILDKAVVDGDVRLVVAVGRAAKESIATWVRAHGGSADPDRLHEASLGSLPNRVRVVGVLHPGSASGGSTRTIRINFQRACDLVRGWLDADPGWLPADPGMPRNLDAPYQYQSAAIPFRDFPFGTCPRLGRGGTPATAPTTSAASACSPPTAATTPPVPTSATPPPPPAAATATATTPATCHTSRHAPPPPPSTAARPPASRACCSAANPASAGPTLPPSASPPTPPSASARSLAAASRTSA
jgi:uracil-DNA glycosylase